MITNEQRAHDIALTLLQSRANDLKPIEAYHEYVNSLLPILKEIDKEKMITNEQRAHDIALTLLQSRANDLKPIEAYHEYVNSLLPILKEIDKDFPNGIKEHL